MPKVSSLGHLGFYVRDMERSVAFYRDILGLQVSDRSPRGEANPNYVGPLGPVKLKTIKMAFIAESAVAFQAYKNGELDVGGVAPEDLAAVEGDPVLSKEYSLNPGSCTFYLGFNVTKAPFDNHEGSPGLRAGARSRRVGARRVQRPWSADADASSRRASPDTRSRISGPSAPRAPRRRSPTPASRMSRHCRRSS